MNYDELKLPENTSPTVLDESLPHLRRLETRTLAATKGSVTLAEARRVFTDGIDDDFRNWDTNVPGGDASETKVDVYSVDRDGTFSNLFGSLGDPHKLCLTQGQIEEFCRSYRNSLQKEGHGTFFLFEVNSNLFVANVFVRAGNLRVLVRHFNCRVLWRAENLRRVVVQQQTA